MVTKEQIKIMRDRISDEVYFALFKKKNGPFHWLIRKLVYIPTTRFSRIFAEADERAALEGLPGAGDSLNHSLNITLNTSGSETIPKQGPLLIVSNHPGAYDSVVVSSSIPRSDVKIMAYEIPFYRTLVNTSQLMIFTTDDTPGRMIALRHAIQHLQNGGALLTFGTGNIDPDPAVEPGAAAAIDEWKSSIEIMLRKVPEAKLTLAIVSGVLQRQFVYHPLTYLHRELMDRRRLAEFMQVIQQLIWPSSIHPRVSLSFAPPISSDELIAESANQRLLPAILAREKSLLETHLQHHPGIL